MTESDHPYLMENMEEAVRLEIKTDPEAVRRQAQWCGIRPGLRVLDAGCGPGKVTAVLSRMIQPAGRILGVDYSQKRIDHATEHYGDDTSTRFMLHDLREPLTGMGPFDVVWARFVLEYNLETSVDIVKNLHAVLVPGGTLCLLDLDYNCLSHYQLPKELEKVLFELMGQMEKDFGFDAYAGRKLYAYLYDLGYLDIQVDMRAHHLFYGNMSEEDMFNWVKKVEVVTRRAPALFAAYPGGPEAFFHDFRKFFLDPRRFTYTPLIMVRGTKP